MKLEMGLERRQDLLKRHITLKLGRNTCPWYRCTADYRLCKLCFYNEGHPTRPRYRLYAPEEEQDVLDTTYVICSHSEAHFWRERKPQCQVQLVREK